jgi:two-component system response regulator YesN
MYKVFLVEDEIVVREGIRNSIAWEKTAYTLAGDAPDGEVALPMIRDIRPDILITDIKMPFMDGLALSRIVKKTLPEIKIIILSGHDEFEYAREAISIGVEEYLLKPISSRDMLKTLDKIAARIDAEKEQVKNIERLKRQIRTHSDTLRERWLLDLVNGKIPAADAIEKARELGIDLIARCYCTAVIGIVFPPENQSQLLTAKGIILTIVEKHPHVLLFREDEKKLIMIIKDAGAPDASGTEDTTESARQPSLEEGVNSLARRIKHEVERNTECKIALGIGAKVGRAGELSSSYFGAKQILNYLLALGLFQISDKLQSETRIFDQTGLLSIDDDPLLIKLKYATKKDIDPLIEGFVELLGNGFEENQMLEYYLFGEIIVAVSKICEELNGDIKAIIPFSLNQHEISQIIKSREVFYEKIRVLLTALIEFRDSTTQGRYRSVILKAREYIDLNYGSEDISLHVVASHVGISPNHLSTVFAQETGENFIDYLTRVRIEKAKQLLKNTGMKNTDIAYETGFGDPHYFSFIFKKNTGVSPREYRSEKAVEPGLS